MTGSERKPPRGSQALLEEAQACLLARVEPVQAGQMRVTLWLSEVQSTGRACKKEILGPLARSSRSLRCGDDLRPGVKDW